MKRSGGTRGTARRLLSAVLLVFVAAALAAGCTAGPSGSDAESSGATASSPVSPPPSSVTSLSSADTTSVSTQPDSTTNAPSVSTLTEPSDTQSSSTRPATSTPPPAPASATLVAPDAPDAVVAATDAASLSIEVSGQVFATAPAVVLVQAADAAAMQQAADHAVRLGVPLLLVDAPAVSTPAISSPGIGTSTPTGAPGTVGGPPINPALAAEILRLGATTVLATDAVAAQSATGLAGVHSVTDPALLPAILLPAPQSTLTVLVPADSSSAGILAATATARAAGATVVPVHGGDPRADPAAITVLAAHPLGRLIGVGADFGPVERLRQRATVAATGVQLPGGGQLMFPGRRLIALYGNPYSPPLGALGQQDLPAAIARAKAVAGEYAGLSTVPVIPTFEIIATIATAAPGSDGDYSAESSVADLLPWVDAATKAGLYVILDLQPGRKNLLDQAKLYADLLAVPSVGLALDPEWKLGPTQRPLQQIGGVEAAEVNQVIDWLGALTAQHHLPQKVLVLHQFRLSMLRDEHSIVTGNDNVAVLIHMDGQGAPNLKDQTWGAVVAAAPSGMYFGWKNFYVKDTPMMTPAQTMAHEPQPLMISYQ